MTRTIRPRIYRRRSASLGLNLAKYDPSVRRRIGRYGVALYSSEDVSFPLEALVRIYAGAGSSPVSGTT